jgi:RNA polymerase sigma-70 factor (ECF subfamily)
VGRLVDAYLRAADANSARAAAAVDLERLERTLAALYTRGRAAYADVAVEDVVFAAHLRRCGAAVEALGADDIQAEDLYLCCAGLLGDQTAIRILRQRNRSALSGYLRPIDGSPTFLDEVEQRLWDAALVGSVDAPPKLASYAGRGPLGVWVGVAAQRIGLMIRRSEAAEKRVLDNIAVQANFVSGDPELAFVKEHLREPFQHAIVKALAALQDRQRMIYTLHVVDGLTMERIAAMYSVSHSTVSRWMVGVREAVIATARRTLRDEMHVTGEEFESLARLLTSQLDLSVSGVFRNSA